MDVEALSSSPIGKLVPITGRDARHGDFSYFAFLPHPLPDSVTLGSGTWTGVSEASTALGRLDQMCSQIPDPRLLIRPALWREALDTSALEGTVGALQELLESQLPSSRFVSAETVEIRAYFQVALRAFDMVTSRPISVGMLSDLQGQLFEQVKAKPGDVGELRSNYVWIGDKSEPIHRSRFVPPPADDRLRAGLDDWVSWVSSADIQLPPVVRAALAHYQFETLHPFGDGNARLGRLAILLQLIRDGALRYPAVTVSPWFLARRRDYQEHLLALSCTGDWNPWVRFFCRAVSEQSSAMVDRVEQLLAWQTEARQRVQARRWSGTIHEVVADLIEWPVITIADTAAKYQVSVVNATRIVNHLVEVGIIKELTGRNYARMFGATEVMRVVEGG